MRTLISIGLLCSLICTTFSFCSKSSNETTSSSSDGISELLVGDWSITCQSAIYNGKQAYYDTTIYNRWVVRRLSTSPLMLFYNHNDSLFASQIDVNMPTAANIVYFSSNAYSIPLTVNDVFLGYGDSIYNKRNNLIFEKDGTITFSYAQDFKQVDYEKSNAKKLVYTTIINTPANNSGKWNYNSTTKKLAYSIHYDSQESKFEYIVDKISDKNVLLTKTTTSDGWNTFSYIRLER